LNFFNIFVDHIYSASCTASRPKTKPSARGQTRPFVSAYHLAEVEKPLTVTTDRHRPEANGFKRNMTA
jgi:hypothetical protein